MITGARIDKLRELNNNPDTPTDFDWITALRAPAIAKLARDDGPLQMSLFDTQDLAEISPPRLPRRTADRLPQPRTGRRTRPQTPRPAARHREGTGPHRRTRAPKATLSGADKIGIAVGKVSGKFKVGKHFHLTITDTGFTYHRDQAAIDAEAALDGIYVLRTSVHTDALDPAAVVDGYKKLANVERDFRIIKSDDLDLRPIHHRLDDRVEAHVLICMLACYLTWHLRKAWAPLTFTDHTPPHRDNPVAPAQRSAGRPRQGLHQTRRRRQPGPQLPRPARPPGHPHPRPNPLPQHRHRNRTSSPTPPPPNDAPSTSSTPPSHSPHRVARHHPPKPTNPQINQGIRYFNRPLTSG